MASKSKTIRRNMQHLQHNGVKPLAVIGNRSARADYWRIKNCIWIALHNQKYDIRIEYKIPEISTRIEAYKCKSYYKQLKRIYNLLLRYAKNSNSLKTDMIGHSGHLEDCDVVLFRCNQVVELDEYHHFNSLRGKVLDLYPSNLPLAFNLKAYQKKCTGANINVVSIWNDVLRDFLPWIVGINPTVRIDVSAISNSIFYLSATDVLNCVMASDAKIKFFKRKKGRISCGKYLDSVSRNVDEEKNIIYKYLLDKYKKVWWGYPSGAHAKLSGYQNSKAYSNLKEIYSALEIQKKKVKIGKSLLSKCDIYIPGEKRIVELDEVRHFTEPRATALKNYPKKLKIAFDKDEYSDFCSQINLKDNDPPNRDEQRAWFDTLRDFLPLSSGEYKPVIRMPLFETKKTNLPLDKRSIITRLENGLKIV